MKKVFVILVIIALIGISTCVFAEEENKLFSDLGEYHWAYDTIKNMVENKIINGYPDGTFKPENSITRAEATKILMLSLRESAVFPYSIDAAPDVPATHWASRYIINGDLYIYPYSDGSFKPEQKITRLEFANALGVALERVAHDDTKEINFTDLEGLDEKSLKNISILVNLGIINGYEDNTFRPDGTLTRAELSKMVSSSLQYRTYKYEAEIENTSGWYEYDAETGWHAPIQHDDNGNLKVMANMNGMPVQIYYDGKMIKESNTSIETVLIEEVKTDDEKEWNVKWYGDRIVDIEESGDGTYLLKNYSTNKEYTLEKDFYTLDEALEIITYFTEIENYKFFEQDGQLCYGNENSFQGVSYELDDNRNKIISAYEIESIIWMFEVNENTIEQKEFIK